MKEVEWKYIMVDLPQLMQELNTGKRRRKEKEERGGGHAEGE